MYLCSFIAVCSSTQCWWNKTERRKKSYETTTTIVMALKFKISMRVFGEYDAKLMKPIRKWHTHFCTRTRRYFCCCCCCCWNAIRAEWDFCFSEFQKAHFGTKRLGNFRLWMNISVIISILRPFALVQLFIIRIVQTLEHIFRLCQIQLSHNYYEMHTQRDI